MRPFVVVLGLPTYYRRFEFAPASRNGLPSQWPDVPDEVFMMLVFKEGTLKDVQEIVRYRSELDVAM